MWLLYSMTSKDLHRMTQNSVRGRVRLADEYAVAFAADFERTRLRCRENHTLARRKNGHDAARRSRLALRKSRDDVKPILLGRVVSDARHLAEVDALGLNRTQT